MNLPPALLLLWGPYATRPLQAYNNLTSTLQLRLRDLSRVVAHYLVGPKPLPFVSAPCGPNFNPHHTATRTTPDLQLRALLGRYDCVVACGLPLMQVAALSDVCRDLGRQLFAGAVHGVSSYVFADLGASHVYTKQVKGVRDRVYWPSSSLPKGVRFEALCVGVAGALQWSAQLCSMYDAPITACMPTSRYSLSALHCLSLLDKGV